MYAPHQPLAGGQVLFIGRAAPTMTLHGIDAIQKPLSELYHKSDRQCCVDDQESIATVLTSGLHIKPINTLDKDTWHRIQDLDSCAAVKAYSDPHQCGALVFVPNDSREARSSDHPTIFAIIMKRSSGIAISDCYAYICPSDEAATTLVQACKQAYSNQCGWSNERPTDAQLGIQKPKVIERECYVDDQKDDCAPEFYEKPLLSGFFYTPRSDLIQKFRIGTEGDEFVPCMPPQRQIEHFTCPCPAPIPQQPALPAPAPPPPVVQCNHVETYPVNPPVCQPAYQQSQMMMVPVDYNQHIAYPDYGHQMQQQQQQQYMIAGPAQGCDIPQQVYHHPTKDQIKAQKKAEKKFQKELKKNHCPSESGSSSSDYYYRQPLREFAGNGNGVVACQEPVYATSLQQQTGDTVPVRMSQQDRLVGIVPSDFALQGKGDIGPPQQQMSAGNNYYVTSLQQQQQQRPQGLVEDEMALYSRRLPQRGGDDCTPLPPGARDFDGNFIMKQHADYKLVGGGGGGGQMRGRSYGVMAGSDQY